MVNKSTFLKKLSSYSALATVVAAAQNADGQIIYTPLKPYVVLTGTNHYSLDLNNDGTTDFTINQFVSYKTSGGVKVNNAVMVCSHSDYVQDSDFSHEPKYRFGAADNAGVLLGESMNIWRANPLIDYKVLPNGSGEGFFAGKGDKYLGLILEKNSKTYFGWARINVNKGCDTIIIKDYAYNAKADSSIKTGQGEPTGIDEINPIPVSLECFPNPAATLVNIIYTTSVSASVTLELYDITGRKIETLLNNAQQASRAQHNTN